MADRAAELSAIAAQRAKNSGQHRINLGQVRSHVIAFFERDELRSRDLARRTLRLVVEVYISGRCGDKASDFPRPKVFGDRAFSQHRVQRRLDDRGIVVEV